MQAEKPHVCALKLDDAICTFLDVETTGLYPYGGDRICEIALLRYKDGEEVASFQTLVNPGCPISPGAYAVNGIDDSMVAHAPLFRSIAGQALKLMEGAVLVAHNAQFDLSFINFELRLLGLSPLHSPVIDTLSLARTLYNFPSNSLGRIRRYMGLPERVEHRAMADVLATRDIFLHMMGDLKEQGIQTLEELMSVRMVKSSEGREGEVVLPPEIDEALKGGRRMKIKYVSGKLEMTERVIKPLEVEVQGSVIYLVAHCYLRDAERTFRLDRIISFTPLDEGE